MFWDLYNYHVQYLYVYSESRDSFMLSGLITVTFTTGNVMLHTWDIVGPR